MKIVDKEDFNWAQAHARISVRFNSEADWNLAMLLLRKAYGLEVAK